ncbi:MAG: penicillin-binding transpeptidase domain-containing protein [Acidimicrobiia bacterium]|nr:penicillin-binding transpeptidase domain-containing protein [Acidimicrobiia bacterium]
MAAQDRGGRDRSGAVVAVLSGFLLTGAVLAGVAILFPDLVADLDLMGTSDDDTTTTAPVEAGSAAEASEVVAGFVTALEAGELGAVRFVDPGATATPGVTTETTSESGTASTPGSSAPRARPETEVGAEFEELTGGLAPFTLDAAEGQVTLLDATTARAPIELTWQFPEGISWTTASDIDLRFVGGEWLVDWQPAILEPSLRPGDRLQRARLAPTRAPILGRGGVLLVDEIALVEIGVQPSRVQDLPLLAQQLEDILGIDGVELASSVEAASPEAFVPVTTLPRTEYDAIRDQVFPLPGTVFRESVRPASVDPNLARALLGRSGEVTAEIIEEFPDRFEPGDYAGLSGLQSTFNGVLTGQPGLEVSVIRSGPDPSTTTTGTGLITTSSVVEIGEPQLLFTVPAADGEPVQTTIDPVVQRAAEAALQRTELTSALVAVEVSTGEVVAVANGPMGATVNFAMTGQYPPGSIFKVVTGYALLRDTLSANDPVECPQTITVSGRGFANAENEVLGVVSFRDAFAHSCNTAFVGATLGFAPETLNATASDFGLGTDYDLGEFAFTGSVPVAEDNVDLAAAAFGQGRVLMSPLSAAVMAATAADGTFRSPVLVTSPARSPQVVTPLEPRAADSLQELMRAVVTEGTGRAVAQVVGAPVSGKTGTAEFGNDNPPKSHAWFVGFQGNLAFAVFVEAGEFGGSTAAPIAADFLNALAVRG